MANWTLILPHIKQWEGGLSSNPKDGCADKPSSIINRTGRDYSGYPYHTNKGVCFKTWVSVAPQLGFPATSEAWYNMTTEQWQKIIKLMFWDKMFLDELPSQNIAEILLEVRWGSGQGGQGKIFIKELQRLIGIPAKDQDGLFGRGTFNALKKYISVKGNEAKLYDALWKFRYKQLDELGKKPAYAWARGGWLNRMNSLFERSKKFVMDNPKTITGIGILVLVGVGYGVYKYLETKTA